MSRWWGPLLLGLVVAVIGYGAILEAIPRGIMAVAERRIAARTGWNDMAFPPLPTAEARSVVRPSPDLAYAICVVDIGKGPVRIDAPALPARYWSVSVFDHRTDVAFVRNNRDSRGGPISIVLAREGQRTPAVVPVVRLPSARAIALLRVLVEDRGAFPAIDRTRRAARCGPA